MSAAPSLSDSVSSAANSGGATSVSPRGTLLGSLFSGGMNILSNYLAYRNQKKLMDYQYEQYFKNARAAGATPAAIAAGITGSAGNFGATASTGGNPMPDLGQSLAAGVSANAAQLQSEASQQNADTEERYKDMLVTYQPKLFKSQAFEATSRAWRDIFGVHLDAAQRELMKQQADEIRLLKPWKVSQAEQTWKNLLQEHAEIIARTGLYKEQQKTEQSMQGYYKSGTEVNYSQRDLNKVLTKKAQQEMFALKWENGLRSVGFDPNKTAFENMLRNAFTNPYKFKRSGEAMLRSLTILDYDMKVTLGKNYKRDIIGLYAGYRNMKYFGNLIQSVGAAAARGAF